MPRKRTLARILELLTLWKSDVVLPGTLIGGGASEPGASFAFKGVLHAFQNTGAIVVKIAKAALADTAYLDFFTGATRKGRIGLDGADVLTVEATNPVKFTQSIVVANAANPASPADGTIWKDTSTGVMRIRQNGATADLGGGVSDGDKGDITVSGGGAAWVIDANTVTTAKIANSAVTNAKLADIATATLIGRSTSGTGAPETLTATLATALLNVFTSALKGLVPASGGGTANFLRADGTWSAPASGSGVPGLIVEDQKPLGTAGGTSVTGFQVRTLNAAVLNTIAGASLAANQITLPAGSYYVEYSAPAVNINNHKAAFYNVTDAAFVSSGTSSYNFGSGSGYAQTDSTGVASFTIAAAKVFELRHAISTAVATDALGKQYNTGVGTVEVYSRVKVWKTA
jgi:hypothetical protein